MSELRINLKANNGQYVVAEGGGGGPVLANRARAGEWETFVLNDSKPPPFDHGSKVTLRAYNGMYVCAENGGGAEVNANRILAFGWEAFSIVHTDGSGGEITNGQSVAFQAANGQYVCAEGGGGGEVVANRDAIGPWETFTIEILELLAAEPEIRIDFNWAGVVMILSHDLTQKILTTTEDAVKIVNILTAAAAGASIAINPAVTATIGVVAGYLNVERQLIQVMDKGKGVYLTIPWVAIYHGLYWVIIPTSR